MAIRDDKLIRFEQFSGINNLSKEAFTTAATLREGIDVDLTREGKVLSRKGYSDVLVPCGNGHSLWADDHLPFALYADDGDLLSFHQDERSEVVRSGLSEGMPLSYARVNNEAFWTNGIDRGMVTADLEALDWCCPNPSGQPALAPGDGDFGGGIVQVCVTHVDRRGRESGASMSASIDLAPGRGVALSAIPQPEDPVDVPRIRIYASCGNDPILYRAADVAAGTLTLTLLAKPQGRAIATQFLTAMPAGQIVRQWNGRQLVARGRFVLWSPALRYGLTHLGHMHVGLPSEVTLMEPVGDGTDGAGVYVSAGPRIYFLRGTDPKNWAQAVVYAWGVVPGSVAMTPARAWGIDSDQIVPVWLALDGHHCIGLPGGNIVTFRQNEVAAGVGERGASVLQQADGLMSFITALRAPVMPRMAVADRIVDRLYDETGRLVS